MSQVLDSWVRFCYSSGGHICGSQHPCAQDQRGQNHGEALPVCTFCGERFVIQKRVSEARSKLFEVPYSNIISSDKAQFTEYIQKNVALHQFRDAMPLTTAAAANFTRSELATALRKAGGGCCTTEFCDQNCRQGWGERICMAQLYQGCPHCFSLRRVYKGF